MRRASAWDFMVCEQKPSAKTREHVDHPSVVMKSKARILIDASDVLFKTVLTHRVAPSDATLIAFKILEVGVLHHPVPILHYIIYILAQSICTLL